MALKWKGKYLASQASPVVPTSTIPRTRVVSDIEIFQIFHLLIFESREVFALCSQ